MNEFEDKNGLKKSQLIILFLILALNAYWIISNFVTFSSHITFEIGVSFFELLIAIFYLVYDYKKPHGNLMKYLLLLYVLSAAILLLSFAPSQPTYVNAMYLCNIVFGTYMAGRLEHYKQNVIICLILLICNAVVSYYLVNMIIGFVIPLTLTNFGSCLGCVTVWLAIAGGYIIRYKLHKEAGFED